MLFGLGVYVGISNPTYEVGYTTAELTSAARSVVLLGPLLAVAAAYRMRDLRAAVAEARPARSMGRVFAGSYWPLLAGGPLAGVLAILSTVRALPDEWRGWMVCAVLAMTLAACVCLGALLGRTLPRVAAIPVAGMASFAWLALPPTGSAIWLRNMNSSFVGCCTAGSTPSTTNFLGSLAVTGAVVALTLGLATVRVWWFGAASRALGASLLALAASVGAGTAAIAAAPADPNRLGVEARETPLACEATDGAGEVCVWPERASRLPDAVRVVDEANEALEAIGAARMTKVSERPEPGAVEFTAAVPTAQDATFSLAQGVVLAAAAECAHPDTASRFEEMAAYAALLFGVEERQWVARGYSQEAMDQATTARSSTDRAQLQYFRTGLADVARSCADQ